MMSSYPNGFSGGMLLRNVPVELPHTGQVFWVNNSSVLPQGGISGSDGNNGSYLKPFSTIDYAIGRCTAGRGDIIYVMPGHSETITAADAILMDVAGVSLVGLGQGALMPTIEYNHANATVGVSADNCLIYGMNFNSSITGVVVGVNVKADTDYCSILGCRFDVDATGTDEFNHSIRLVDNNTGCRIEGNTFHMGLGGAVAGIHLDADTANTVIKNNYMTGDYSTACIAGDTTLSTNILIDGNLLVQGIAGNIGTEPGIELLTGTTGIIQNNNIMCNLANAAASIVADACFLFQNYYNETASSSTTGAVIGTPQA